MPSLSFTQQQMDEVVSRYGAGETAASIATALQKTVVSVRGLIHRKIGKRETRLHFKGFVSDPTCFANPNSSERAAYFVGLLITDGNVSTASRSNGKSSTPHVSLSLVESDRVMVDELNQFLGGRYRVQIREPRAGRYGKTGQARITFGCKQIVGDLLNWGITPRKSATAKLHDSLVPNRHVWRGIIDGNGCLTWAMTKGGNYRLPVINLVGSEALLTQFVQFVKCVCPGFAGSVRAANKVNFLKSVSVTGRHAMRLAAHLYSECSIALPRKLSKANGLMNWQPMRPGVLNRP